MSNELIKVEPKTMVLTPDDPSDEEKLLIKIQNLLNEPKNDAEKFRLAQANLLLSISRKPINLDGVQFLCCQLHVNICQLRIITANFVTTYANSVLSLPTSCQHMPTPIYHCQLYDNICQL